MPEERDEELERLIIDLLLIAAAVLHEEPEQSSRRVRAFALRLLRERQLAINGALEEAAAILAAGGNAAGAVVLRTMKVSGR